MITPENEPSEVVSPQCLAALNREVTPYRWYVYCACAVLAIALNYVIGKETAWDLLHYHFYAGFSALNDRFDRDYFAAGAQSYFNPYAYVPFYALVKLGLPALAVGTILATIQSVVLWITYELACSVCPSNNRKGRFFFGSCATALAFMNPIFMQQIGSSFADITTTGLVLGGWLLLVDVIRRPRLKPVVVAALLLGVATALKPTNGLHALAGAVLLAFVPLPFFARIKTPVYFFAALGAGFVLASAPWSFRLMKQFGNPMFPLLNNLFRSPEFTTDALKHYRFIPDSLTDALLRPFTISSTADMIHDEMAAPDVRYALLVIVFFIYIVARLWRPIKHSSDAVEAARYRSTTRALVALGCAFVADWIVWLAGSGNSRYFIPMACIAAVLASALLFRLLINHPTGRNGILLALFAAQCTQLVLAADFRWSQAPWGGHWFEVNIPGALSTEANLYLTIGMQSNSFIVPFLGEGSGAVNFSGGYVLGPDGANARRVRALIARNAPHLRVLVSGATIYPNAARREPRQSDVDDVLRAFALRVDMKDCKTIDVQGIRPSVWQPLESSIPTPVTLNRKLRYTTHLVSCHLVADTRDQSEELAARRAADIVLNRLEDSCPLLFQPRRPQTEHINQMWVRVYPSTDLSAWVGNGQVKFIDPTRGVPHGSIVGTAEAWERKALPIECGRRNGIYFATLIGTEQ